MKKLTRTVLMGIVAITILPLVASAETSDSAKNLMYSRKSVTIKKLSNFADQKYSASKDSVQPILTAAPKAGVIDTNSKKDPSAFDVSREGLVPWDTVSPNNRIKKSFWTTDVAEKAYFKPLISTKEEPFSYERYNRPAKNSLAETRSGYSKIMRLYFGK